ASATVAPGTCRRASEISFSRKVRADCRKRRLSSLSEKSIAASSGRLAPGLGPRVLRRRVEPARQAEEGFGGGALQDLMGAHAERDRRTEPEGVVPVVVRVVADLELRGERLLAGDHAARPLCALGEIDDALAMRRSQHLVDRTFGARSPRVHAIA